MFKLHPRVVELVGLSFFLPFIKTGLALNKGNPDLFKPHAVDKDYWQPWCADVLCAAEQDVTLLNSGAFMAIMVNEPYCLVEAANPLGHCDFLIHKCFLAAEQMLCNAVEQDEVWRLYSVGCSSINLYFMINVPFVAGETRDEPVAPIESPSNSQQSFSLKESHSLHLPLLPMG